MDFRTLVVTAEAGWSYAGKSRVLGDQFQVDKDAVSSLQKYIDNGDIEMVVETKAIDAKKQGDIIGVAVTEAMKTFAPVIEDMKKSIVKIGRVHDRYNDDPEYQENGGYKTFTSFLKDVQLAGISAGKPSDKLDKWLASDDVAKEQKAATGMGIAIQSDGGILAPTAFRNQILTNAVEESIVFPRSTFIPVPTGSVEIPAVEVSSHATSLFGGVVAYWGDEGTAPTASKPKFGKVGLRLNALKAIAHVTDELLEDSIISLESMLPAQFSAALSFQMDEAFLTGTGVGKPKGVTNSACLVTVAKETDQLASTIVAENIINMYSRMYPPSRGRAVWIANNDTFPQLSTMSLPVGTGGSTVGILQMQTLQGNPIPSLLGAPIIFTEKVASIGTANDIMFCDFSQYLVGGRSASGQAMQSSIHLKFDQFETSFRISQRMDGTPWWKTALTPRNGSTLSPFVGLAVRA